MTHSPVETFHRQEEKILTQLLLLTCTHYSKKVFGNMNFSDSRNFTFNELKFSAWACMWGRESRLVSATTKSESSVSLCWEQDEKWRLSIIARITFSRYIWDFKHLERKILNHCVVGCVFVLLWSFDFHVWIWYIQISFFPTLEFPHVATVKITKMEIFIGNFKPVFNKCM